MKKMVENWQTSYLFGNNADFIEELYDAYLIDPQSVEPKWKKYFDSLQGGGSPDVMHTQVRDKFAYLTQHAHLQSSGSDVSNAQSRVWQLIDNYRTLGMEYANLDPLKRSLRIRPAALDLDMLGLSGELDHEFYLDMDLTNTKKLKLKSIIDLFEKTYCGNVSFEFEHISELTEREWLRSYAETKAPTFNLETSAKLNILQKLTEAEGWERYLHTKYVGQKRFSLEGGESFIPMLDRLINLAATNSMQEVYIGMSHRGRLNTLVNIAGKTPAKLFAEFDGNYPAPEFVTTGDVKYHKGYKCNYVTSAGTVKTTLAYNPSHLEMVNPVVNGMMRSCIDKGTDQSKVLGIIVHGDSALIGLGTNQGVFNMSQTRAYGVGGIMHIVINNQVGFTTSDMRDTRTSRFCTDIIKMIEAPVIHVNADDLNGVAFAVDLAFNYRATFKKDIMIDLVCFRRHGHNESDDPTLTQPYMYSKIKAHPGTRKLYADGLIKSGIVTSEQVTSMMEDYRNGLIKGVHIDAGRMQALKWYDMDMSIFTKAKADDVVKTTISAKDIAKYTQLLTDLPSKDFTLHSNVARLMENRKLMGKGEAPIDFGMAETLAYASLLQDGITIRMSGEDSGRGTFSHRNAVWHDVSRSDVSDSGFMPLSRLENKSKMYLYDSVLNEECVLGFEYGYSTASLRDLVIWEAQFGDFANGAQVVIDQFIASGETKWGTLSNLTMILPHGFDGQGPEHSSARLERYLQLCAENNMQVVIPTTAAQVFHLLRRKALTNWVKPLVFLLSKKLLRYKDAMSDITEFTDGAFQPVIADATVRAAEVTHVVACSGQVYYDLVQERASRKLDKTFAIVRVEQLYPFPSKELQKELAKYTGAKKFIWAQEEPHNQGAWLQIRDALDDVLVASSKGKSVTRFTSVSRPAAAAPACGWTSMHEAQLRQILDEVFIK